MHEVWDDVFDVDMPVAWTPEQYHVMSAAHRYDPVDQSVGMSFGMIMTVQPDVRQEILKT